MSQGSFINREDTPFGRGAPLGDESLEDSLDAIMSEAKRATLAETALTEEEAAGAQATLHAAFADTGALPLSMEARGLAAFGGRPQEGAADGTDLTKDGVPASHVEDRALLRRLALPGIVTTAPSTPVALAEAAPPVTVRPLRAVTLPTPPAAVAPPTPPAAVAPPRPRLAAPGSAPETPPVRGKPRRPAVTLPRLGAFLVAMLLLGLGLGALVRSRGSSPAVHLNTPEPDNLDRVVIKRLPPRPATRRKRELPVAAKPVPVPKVLIETPAHDSDRVDDSPRGLPRAVHPVPAPVSERPLSVQPARPHPARPSSTPAVPSTKKKDWIDPFAP